MKNVITAQAESAREEALTGFLLGYQNHFIHLVEVSRVNSATVSTDSL